jgi:hypothetical protein
MLQGYPERFAQETLGHNSKAVHRAYAKRALMKIPSLEEGQFVGHHDRCPRAVEQFQDQLIQVPQTDRVQSYRRFIEKRISGSNAIARRWPWFLSLPFHW